MDKNFLFYNEKKLSKSQIWILFLFLGWSYGSMGQMGKQILFYITGGGLFMWLIYRLFTLNKAIKKYNQKIADECGISYEDQKLMGLL